MPEARKTALSLAPEQLAALLEEMAAQTRAGIPWADALNAADQPAERSQPGRPRFGRGRSLANALQTLADQLHRGRSVDEVLSQIGGEYGPQLAAVVEAGAASGRPADALAGLAGLIRQRLEHRLRLRAALVYPLIVSLFALLILIGGLAWITRDGAEWMSPPVANWLQYWWLVPALLAVVGLVSVLFRRRIVESLPLRLRPVRWARLAWFAELVALEVEQGIPMDRAVRLSADASGDAALRRAAATWRDANERGAPPSATRGVPQLLVWSLRQGAESAAGLPETLRRLANVYWRRSERASLLISAVIPAVLIVGVTGSLAIAFVLFVLGPIYRSFS